MSRARQESSGARPSRRRHASGTMNVSRPLTWSEEARVIVEAVAAPIVVCDGRGRIAQMSPAAERLLGWRAAEASSRPCDEVVTLRAAAGEAIEAARIESAADSGGLRGVQLVSRDGAVHAVDVTVSRVGGDGGFVLTVHDASAASAMQERLLQVDRLAALGTLAAGVAHEINNPLTYVLVNLEHVVRQLRSRVAACEGLGPEDIEVQLTALGQSLEGATRVRGIVRDLMTFSHGRVEAKTLVDVRRVLEASLQMTAHELRHRAHVERRFRQVPPVYGNEARLGQVFLNLLVNAAHAIPEGSAASNTVTVETDVDDKGSVVVVVEDTGEGIAPQDLPRVFDPFFTTRPTGEATGLGLSIAHGIVASFGGSMTVDSVPGIGTRFRITLPVAPGYEMQGDRTASSVSLQAVRRRVLVIDEDPLVAGAIAKSLSDEHDAEVTTDAGDALARLARGERYDVILCDLMMPNVTGMDFYREVLRMDPELASRIIFMSGGVYTPRARAFVEALPNRCIEKPPDSGKLRALVRRRGAQ